MPMLQRLAHFACSIRRQLRFYRLVARHERTPRAAKWCLAAAVAYALSPVDLIPDFLPVIGHVDDVVIIPTLVAVGLWLAPKDVIAECRAAARS